MLKYVCVCGLFAVFCLGALAEPRVWTSSNGQKATAEFEDLEGETLVLKKGTKMIRMPLDGFSAEDQVYARKRIEAKRTEKIRLEKERTEKLESLKGYRRNEPVVARRWANWEDYYEESSCGKKVQKFFDNERSIVDVAEKGVFVSAQHAVRPPDYAPLMAAYCPPDYDGQEKLGVYIFISPGNNAAVPSAGYKKMMDKHRLVYASPKGAGNKESDMRRCALALDVLAQLRLDYNVDEDRIYIGGTSGGGAESTIATFLYPEEFRAALNSVRSFTLTSSSCLPFADASDIRKVSKYKQPYAFISGPGDSNYAYMPASEQSFRDHRFVVRFFDIPGMKHQKASPDTLDTVIQWVDENNPRLKK